MAVTSEITRDSWEMNGHIYIYIYIQSPKVTLLGKHKPVPSSTFSTSITSVLIRPLNTQRGPLIDLVLLVDFFPETLGNGTTLRLLWAGKTSVDASATVRKEPVSVTHVHSYKHCYGKSRHVLLFLFCLHTKNLSKQECEHLLQFLHVQLLSSSQSIEVAVLTWTFSCSKPEGCQTRRRHAPGYCLLRF